MTAYDTAFLVPVVAAWAGRGHRSNGPHSATELGILAVFGGIALLFFVVGKALSGFGPPQRAGRSLLPEAGPRIPPPAPHLAIGQDGVYVVGWPGADRASRVLAGIHTLNLDGRKVPWIEIREVRPNGRSIWIRVDGEVVEVEPITREGLDALVSACREAMARARTLGPIDRSARDAIERLRDRTPRE